LTAARKLQEESLAIHRSVLGPKHSTSQDAQPSTLPQAQSASATQ